MSCSCANSNCMAHFPLICESSCFYSNWNGRLLKRPPEVGHELLLCLGWFNGLAAEGRIINGRWFGRGAGLPKRSSERPAIRPGRLR
jgi:hypothetical protein